MTSIEKLNDLVVKQITFTITNTESHYKEISQVQTMVGKKMSCCIGLENAIDWLYKTAFEEFPEKFAPPSDNEKKE